VDKQKSTSDSGEGKLEIPMSSGKTKTSVTIETTPTEIKKYKNRLRRSQILLGLGLILLVLLTVTTVGFLANQIKKLKQKAQRPTSYQECTEAPGSKVQETYPAICATKDGVRFVQPLSEEEQKKLKPPEETENWKAYTNQEFSFKYPSTWSDAKTNTLSTGTTVIVNDGRESDYQISTRLEITSGSYYNQDLQREMTLDELIENREFSAGEDLTSDKIELGNYKGFRYTYYGHGVGYYITSVVLTRPEAPTHILVIVYRHDSAPEYKSEMPKTLDQILSTFKFLETSKSDSKVNWKTFNHSVIIASKQNYLKSFKLYYPSSWNLEIQGEDEEYVNLKISYGKSWLDIRQGSGSVGWCLYPENKGDLNAPAFSSFYTDYFEFKKNDDIVWRLTKVDTTKEKYILCEKGNTDRNKKYFHQDTSIGYIPIYISESDTGAFELMKEVIQRIKII